MPSPSRETGLPPYGTFSVSQLADDTVAGGDMSDPVVTLYFNCYLCERCELGKIEYSAVIFCYTLAEGSH